MKNLLITLHLAILIKCIYGDKIILQQSSHQYFDMLTQYNPIIQEISYGNLTNGQIITQLKNINGDHYLSYYHNIDDIVTISIDYQYMEYLKQFQITLNLSEYYQQELLFQVEVNKQESHILIVLNQLNGQQYIREIIDINQFQQFDEWLISEKIENHKQYQGLIKYKSDYLIKDSNINFNNKNIIVLQNNEFRVANDTIFKQIDYINISLKLLSNENMTLIIDRINIQENQKVQWKFINFSNIHLVNITQTKNIHAMYVDSYFNIDIDSPRFQGLYIRNNIFYQNSNIQISLNRANYIELSNSTFISKTYIRNSYLVNINQSDFSDDLYINLANLTFRKCDFYYTSLINYDQFQRNLIIKLENVVFDDCQFNQFTFFTGKLYYMYQFITQFILENVQFKNCQFTNSSVFNGLHRIKIVNLSFENCCMINTRFFIFLTSFQGQNITLNQIVFATSKLISSEYKQMYLDIFVDIKSLVISNSQLSGSMIDTTDDVNYYPMKLRLLDLEMKNNKILSTSQLFDIRAEHAIIKNFIMPPEFNLYNFYFRNSKDILIENGIIDGNSKLSNGLIISVSQVDNIIIKNVSFTNLYIQDEPILYFYGSKFQSFVQFRMINCTISDATISSQNFDNMLSLDSGSIGNIRFEKLIVKNINLIIQQVKGLSVGSIFFIVLAQGSVQLRDMLVENINLQLKDKTLYQSPLVYSSSDAFLLKDCNFKNINDKAEILNQGGISKIFADIIIIQRNFIQNVRAKAGGAFFIRLNKHEGFIKIDECHFQNIQVIDQLNGNGGILNFDVLDGKFKLEIINNIIQNITTSQIGGFIYIQPQYIIGNISIINNTLTDVYAQQSSLIRILAQGQCRIIVQDLYVSSQGSMLQFQQVDSSQIQIEASYLKIQNFHFTGNSNEGLLDLRQNSDIILSEILMQDSIFYESTIIQIVQSQNEIFNLKIEDLIIINCQVIQQEFMNKRLLVQSNQNQMILIEASNHSNINIHKVYLKNNQCNQCQLGQFNLLNGNGTMNGLVNNFQFTNNFGSNYGLLYIRNVSNLNIFYGIFYNNQAVFNSAITSIYSNIHISESHLISDNQNHILIDNQSYIYLHNTQMVQMQNSIYQMEYIIEKQITEVVNNYSLSSHPVNLRVKYQYYFLKSKVTQQGQLVIETTHVQPYNIYGTSEKQTIILMPSKKTKNYYYYDPYTLKDLAYDLNYTIVICDNKGDQIKDTQIGNLVKINSYIFNMSSQTPVKFIGEQYIEYDQLVDGFPLIGLNIQFNPYSEKDLCYQARITSDQITSDYIHVINLRTFRCQIGEYLQDDQCKQCDQNLNQYSLKFDQNICQIYNQEMIESFQHNKVQLKAGFWRQSILSHKFLYCARKDSCIGGWYAGNQQCLIGYIGPLCEECDYNNIRGNGYYAFDNHECNQCQNDINKIINVIFTVFFILFATYLVIRNIEDQIQKYLKYMLSYKQHEIIYRLDQSQINSYIKIFIQAMILYTVIDDSNKTLYNIQFLTHPLLSIHNNLICLITIIHQNPKHFQIISYILIILIILILEYLILLVSQLRHKTKNINSKLVGSFLFYFIYFQPDIIQVLAKFISIRRIGDYIFVKGNILFEYTSPYHMIWVIYLIIPLFCILGITIPTLIYYFLHKIRHKLNNKQIRMKFSILFDEYKQNYYYFELIKILLKQALIIILISDFQLYTIQISFAILYLYQKFLINKNPYNSKKVNEFEISITAIIQTQIIILFIITYLDHKDQVYDLLKDLFSYLFLVIILKYLKLMLYDNKQLIESIISLILILLNKQKWLARLFPSISIKLLNHMNTKNRINMLYQQLRYHLKVTGRIVSRRASQQDQVSINFQSRTYNLITL